MYFSRSVEVLAFEKYVSLTMAARFRNLPKIQQASESLSISDVYRSCVRRTTFRRDISTLALGNHIVLDRASIVIALLFARQVLVNAVQGRLVYAVEYALKVVGR